MLGPAFAAAVCAVVIVLAFASDALAQGWRPETRRHRARRFDRTFQRNLAARSGRHERQ